MDSVLSGNTVDKVIDAVIGDDDDDDDVDTSTPPGTVIQPTT